MVQFSLLPTHQFHMNIRGCVPSYLIGHIMQLLKKFGFVFGNICELVEKLSIPVPNNIPVTIYEFSIIFDDNSKSTINTITNHDILDMLFNETHKLIPEVDGVPSEFDSKSNPKNKSEDLYGDYAEPVRFEDTEGNAID